MKLLTIINLLKDPLCCSQLVCSQESACFIVAQAQPLVQYENKREIMDSGWVQSHQVTVKLRFVLHVIKTATPHFFAFFRDADAGS